MIRTLVNVFDNHCSHFVTPSSVPLEQELSKSHESVFREPGDMAMLTIGLKVSASFKIVGILLL